MKNGILFGKFAPLTVGHRSLIKKAAEQVDHLYLFLSFDQKFIATQSPNIQPLLGFHYRLRDLVKEVDSLKITKKVTVSWVDESDIPGYPEGSLAYAKLLRSKLSILLPPGEKVTVAFSSEQEYTSYFSEFFPECDHVIIDSDRKVVPCSATMVREDMTANFKYLSHSAKERFVRKVAIVGVESTGKSTLTSLLAHHYSALFTPEVGRLICESDFNSREDLMHRDDYLAIAHSHKVMENSKLKASTCPVVFSDTTNLITHFSGICADRVSLYDPSFSTLNFEEEKYYDLVLYLQPDVPWVKDNLRLQDTPEKRNKTNNLLESMIKTFYNEDKVVKIWGSDFDHRTQQAIYHVDRLLQRGFK